MPSSAPAQVRLRAFEFKTPASGRLTAAPNLWMLLKAPDFNARLSCTPSKLSSEKVLPPLSRKSEPARSGLPSGGEGSNSLLRTPACNQRPSQPAHFLSLRTAVTMITPEAPEVLLVTFSQTPVL